MAPCVRLAIFMTPNMRVKPNAMIIQMAVWTSAFKMTWTIMLTLHPLEPFQFLKKGKLTLGRLEDISPPASTDPNTNLS